MRICTGYLMKRFHLLFILYITFFTLAMINSAQAQTNNKTYTIIYDEAHAQYFTNAVKQGLLRSHGHGKYSLTLSSESLISTM